MIYFLSSFKKIRSTVSEKRDGQNWCRRKKWNNKNNNDKKNNNNNRNNNKKQSKTNMSHKLRLGAITRFDCVWMQTQKSPSDPPYQNSGYQPIPHFKILLDINFHWNRRPLTIWRFCWQPFWKWWPHKIDPECKFHHYQQIPHFKILLDINFHWNRRLLTICRFCWRLFWKRWHRKNDSECNFHHYQLITHFKITLDINFHWN